METVRTILRWILSWFVSATPKCVEPLYNRLKQAKFINLTGLYEYRDWDWHIEKCVEKPVTGSDLVIHECVILGSKLGEKDRESKIRAIPNQRSKNKDKYDYLWLNFYYEQSYTDDFNQVLSDRTGKFIITNDDDSEDTFYRVGNLLDPIETDDGEIFYDFYREVDGSTEHCIVEMDKKSGWFKIWKGREIYPEQILPM